MIICGKSNLNIVSSFLCLYKNVCLQQKQVKVFELKKFSCYFFLMFYLYCCKILCRMFWNWNKWFECCIFYTLQPSDFMCLQTCITCILKVLHKAYHELILYSADGLRYAVLICGELCSPQMFSLAQCLH